MEDLFSGRRVVEGDVPGTGRTFPTDERKEVRVFARMKQSEEMAIKDTENGGFFYTWELTCAHTVSGAS